MEFLAIIYYYPASNTVSVIIYALSEWREPNIFGVEGWYDREVQKELATPFSVVWWMSSPGSLPFTLILNYVTLLISLQLMYMIYLLQIDSATWQHFHYARVPSMVYIIFDFEFFIRFLPSSGPQQVVARWRLAAPYSSLIFRRNITFFQQTRYKSRITLHYQLYHILSLEGGGGGAHHRWCSIVSGAWWPLTEVITIQLTIIYNGELRRESTPFCTFLQKSFRFFIQNIFWKLKNSPYWNWEMKIISRFARLYPRRMGLANILSEWFRNLGNFWLGHAPEPP